MKKIHIVLFGVGNVGSTLINQILETRAQWRENGLEVNIPVITNSTTAFFAKENLENSWETDFKKFGFPYNLDSILSYVKKQEYENLIAIDATASENFVRHYKQLIKNGFNIIAANKAANTLSGKFYKDLRIDLKQQGKYFLYETNVGAGLPIIQTLQSLHASGEKVTKIRGVFSGSLSYIFNEFSKENKAFDEVLTDAGNKGFTEPDPRIDLSGKDVARKLLILARELEIQKELSEISIEDLVPSHLNGKSSLSHFKEHQYQLNEGFRERKSKLKNDEVLRHIGELDVASGILEVKLINEKKSSPFGSLKNADASFEIYTSSYGDQPIVIQGAGAGGAVTARGVVADILKLSERLEAIN
ncbi:aspartate kinase [Gillisia sp. M10.2A]|uniref:Homoserine dehydrogenase n=1 Tax=Gillisia lutea TaxID=2909668 RepID=A0ABS9EGG5_9FLAO|nr:aspartate kinase [Gillisia lutea]MCF4101982.1 aspartate kinase [Gillisia lutea]